MAIVQSEYRNDSRPLPKAKIVQLNQSGSTPSLELRVNIEGQDHAILLPLDALTSYELSGPAVATALQTIQHRLSEIDRNMPVSGEIANLLFAILEARYDLPKKQETE